MRRSFLFGKCSGKVLCSCLSDAFHGLTSSDQRKDLYESTAMKEGGATSSFKRDEAGDGVPSGVIRCRFLHFVSGIDATTEDACPSCTNVYLKVWFSLG